jgi:beta-glucanase (GH16 family)
VVRPSGFAFISLLFSSGCTVAPPPDDQGLTLSSSPEPDLVPEESAFSLLFQEDFDTLDPTRWETGSHTFSENAAQFSSEMVTTADGILRIGLGENPDPEAERNYLSGEVRTVETFLYGRFETRAKFASGSGVVSSLFTFYDHWSDPALEENWNELDVEFLGGHPGTIHFNVIHFSDAGYKTMHQAGAETSFNPADDFHVYTIDWLPDVVHFYVDRELLHSQTNQIEEQVNLPQKLMMNVWPVQSTPGLNEWAGEFDESALGTAAHYDWIRVYRLF